MSQLTYHLYNKWYWVGIYAGIGVLKFVLVRGFGKSGKICVRKTVIRAYTHVGSQSAGLSARACLAVTVWHGQPDVAHAYSNPAVTHARPTIRQLTIDFFIIHYKNGTRRAFPGKDLPEAASASIRSSRGPA